jgi:hypothetical protein
MSTYHFHNELREVLLHPLQVGRVGFREVKENIESQLVRKWRSQA